ncbi:unnamed protein product [Timema podura]|uniref:Uncharacterized protein n=1 Tax=Timema podura TaxID=61482 RepID=A0ABN7NPK2_TIMPD|nr:unnamed protein product [Timema podura]
MSETMSKENNLHVVNKKPGVIRASMLMKGCSCNKRNGLQTSCNICQTPAEPGQDNNGTAKLKNSTTNSSMVEYPPTRSMDLKTPPANQAVVPQNDNLIPSQKQFEIKQNSDLPPLQKYYQQMCGGQGHVTYATHPEANVCGHMRQSYIGTPYPKGHVANTHGMAPKSIHYNPSIPQHEHGSYAKAAITTEPTLKGSPRGDHVSPQEAPYGYGTPLVNSGKNPHDYHTNNASLASGESLPENRGNYAHPSSNQHQIYSSPMPNQHNAPYYPPHSHDHQGASFTNPEGYHHHNTTNMERHEPPRGYTQVQHYHGGSNTAPLAENGQHYHGGSNTASLEAKDQRYHDITSQISPREEPHTPRYQSDLNTASLKERDHYYRGGSNTAPIAANDNHYHGGSNTAPLMANDHHYHGRSNTAPLAENDHHYRGGSNTAPLAANDHYYHGGSNTVPLVANDHHHHGGSNTASLAANDHHYHGGSNIMSPVTNNQHYQGMTTLTSPRGVYNPVTHQMKHYDQASSGDSLQQPTTGSSNTSQARNEPGYPPLGEERHPPQTAEVLPVSNNYANPQTATSSIPGHVCNMSPRGHSHVMHQQAADTTKEVCFLPQRSSPEHRPPTQSPASYAAPINTLESPRGHPSEGYHGPTNPCQHTALTTENFTPGGKLYPGYSRPEFSPSTSPRYSEVYKQQPDTPAVEGHSGAPGTHTCAGH